jgi:mandelate racemase
MTMVGSPKVTIAEVQARPVIAPLEPPIRTASGAVVRAPMLLIDLVTREGVVGRSYLFGYQTFTLKPLRDLVVALGGIVKGDSVTPLDLDRKLRGQMTLFGTRGLQGMALSGFLDMAAWDALAVAAGLPLATLLGGRPRPIPAYNSLSVPEAIRRGRALESEGVSWIEEPVRADPPGSDPVRGGRPPLTRPIIRSP